MKKFIALWLTIAPLMGEETVKPLSGLEARGAAGEAGAMVELGRLYLHGKDRPRDPGQAMQWFLKGAAQGNSAAQVGVGYLLSNGIGRPIDRAGAGEWFRKAAEQNDAKGQYNMAVLLYEGYLGPGKIPEAMVWFTKAAEQGLTEAQALLGQKYFLSADGVKQHFGMAAYWLEKAAAAGDNQSRTTFGSMLRFGNAVPENKVRAYGLFLAASRQGYAKAMCQLGDMLAEGEGTGKQPVQAAAWYVKAAGLGEKAGQDRWEALKLSLTPEQVGEAERLAGALPIDQSSDQAAGSREAD